MEIAAYFLLGFLVVCAVSVAFTKNVFHAVLIQLGYSAVMSVVWLLLESPDLAITEAAVGAGLTGVLFFVTLRRVGLIGGHENRTEAGEPAKGESGKGGGRP